MRRLLIVVLVSAGLILSACNPVPADELARWKHDLSHVTPVSDPPPIVRALLNTTIRTGVPIVCPILADQAEPAYRPFITGTCAAIVASNDPFTTLVTVLPLLCAGDPPLGAQAYPKLALAMEHGCPLLVQLVPLLGLADYLPGMGATAGAPTG